jgi:hypothetical protein
MMLSLATSGLAIAKVRGQIACYKELVCQSCYTGRWWQNTKLTGVAKLRQGRAGGQK